MKQLIEFEIISEFNTRSTESKGVGGAKLINFIFCSCNVSTLWLCFLVVWVRSHATCRLNQVSLLFDRSQKIDKSWKLKVLWVCGLKLDYVTLPSFPDSISPKSVMQTNWMFFNSSLHHLDGLKWREGRVTRLDVKNSVVNLRKSLLH